MLIVRVFVDTGLIPAFDPRPYTEDWHLHRSEERYLGFVTDRCTEVKRPRSGDIVVFRYGRCYSHGGIVTSSDPLSMVHAFQPAGLVYEEMVAHNAELAKPTRRPRAFSLWREGER
ncbi:hypothetical protein [Methylocella silvestris]|nr:hypothetical protein [Methylocella silvestris]